MTSALHEAKTFLRHAHVVVDLGKLRANLLRLRGECGAECRIYAVVKGDGYGAGLIASSRELEAAGVDGLAVGNADDVTKLRQAGIKADILAYGSTPPDRADELVGLDAILTVHDVASSEAILSAATRGRGVTRVFVKADCGLARLGVAPQDLDGVISSLTGHQSIRLEGLYTHLSAQHDPDRVTQQAQALTHATQIAARYGGTSLVLMLASSRVIFEHPSLKLTAVDPGRVLFGLARHDWDVGHQYETVIARFAARIVQVSQLSEGTIPYGSDQPLDKPLRVGVVAAGTSDGLLFTRAGQPLLVRGSRVVQLGPPGIEHSMIDLSAVPDAQVGDEVVFFGSDGEEVITPLQFAAFCDRPIDQTMPVIGRLARRVYINGTTIEPRKRGPTTTA